MTNLSRRGFLAGTAAAVAIPKSISNLPPVPGNIREDISVTSAGNIRWSGGYSQARYTVDQLHSYLQDLADDVCCAGDDDLDITCENPSRRDRDGTIHLIGKMNIDDELAKHICGGELSQEGAVYSSIVSIDIVEKNHIERA